MVDPHSPLSRPREVRSTLRFEILAPDEYSAALLVARAAAHFPVAVAGGAELLVKLCPPGRPGSAFRVRLLVEGWLEAVPLPCVTVLHSGRSYVIRRRVSRRETADTYVARKPRRPERPLLSSVPRHPGGGHAA